MKIQYNNQGITIFESALYRTTTTIVSIGHALLIVDPNWVPDEITFIQDFISANYARHRQYLVFTHSDYDHIIGYGAFLGATVIASQNFVLNAEKVRILDQIRAFDNQFYITRSYPVTYPHADIIICDDGQKILIEGQEIYFYHAQGHVRDGLFVLIPDKNCWIAGDYLSNIEIPMVDDDFDAYHETLLKASNLINEYKTIHLLITGHGDHAGDREEVNKRIGNDLQYLSMLKIAIADGQMHISDRLTRLILGYSQNPEMMKIHEINVRKMTGVIN
jgi:glyoxylase-like metal-dependent hydrolase (beta-lactamase superfamily II)